MATSILVVDDTESNRYTLKRYLEREGYDVLEAGFGAECLEMAFAERPDMIILDVKLPDQLGYEVCRRLKADARTASTPVLQVSAAMTNTGDFAAGAESGADGYLRMPLKPGELVVSVKSLLRMKRAEGRAERLAGHVNATFDAMRDAICLVDERGCIELANSAFRKLMELEEGLSEDALFAHAVGRKGFDVTPLFRALESGKRETAEQQVAERWWSVAVDPFETGAETRAAVCIFADATERKEAESALRERELRFRQLASAIPQLVWISGRDASVEYVNKRWVARTGLSEGNLQDWLRVVHREDRDETWRAWSEAVEGGKTFEMEHRLLDGNTGEHSWFLTHGIPVRSEEDDQVRWFFTATEIELQKQAAQSLMQAKEEAEAANRTKSAFLAHMSHEIRTPLTTIIGFAELLGEGPPEAFGRVGETIRQSAVDLLAILNSVLDLARLEGRKLQLNPESVDLVELGESLAQQMNVQASERIRFDCSLPDQALMAHLDRSALLRVVSNLLSNAFKFTNDGSVHLRLEEDDGFGRFTVEDTGVGFPEDFREKLFQPFERAPSKGRVRRDGFGLGLAITRELVSLLRGTIEVESREGVGSTFVVRVPLDARMSRPGGMQEAAEPPSTVEPHHRLRILAVEDDHRISELIVRMLGDQHKLEPARELEEARRLALAEDFDLILMDISLDGDGEAGVNLMKELREEPRYRAVPFIAMTALALPEDRERLLENGFDDYIRKPFTSGHLRDALRRNSSESARGVEG